ncbi:hypothetical protein TNCT_366181 [Trichonephila clavata]|uniref:Uncharacterized protein n=1 Tax=Trichonephila clavata TaxID=2740835 RepID=A0A8X6KSE1_TRICU|nr:hypothetical protein TNCT_366181 [Trichonephila clavata]
MDYFQSPQGHQKWNKICRLYIPLCNNMHRKQRLFFQSVFNLSRKAWAQRNSHLQIDIRGHSKTTECHGPRRKAIQNLSSNKMVTGKAHRFRIYIKFPCKKKSFNFLFHRDTSAVLTFDSTFPHWSS